MPEDNLQEQEMLEAAIEVVAEMQLTADELKVHLICQHMCCFHAIMLIT